MWHGVPPFPRDDRKCSTQPASNSGNQKEGAHLNKKNPQKSAARELWRVTCTFRRFPSSALSSALTSSRGALM